MQATTPEDNSSFSREKEELPRAGLEPAIYDVHYLITCIVDKTSTHPCVGLLCADCCVPTAVC